jgi:hypothetical protein
MRHDYRRGDWGHSCFVWPTGQTPKKDGSRKFCVFGHVQEGDELILSMVSGQDAVWKVTSINSHPTDPGDQYFITAKPIDYLEE